MSDALCRSTAERILERDKTGRSVRAAFMVAMNEIEQFGRRVGREFGADRVVLFGSYARGTPSPDSDVDLLVIGSFRGRSVDTSVEIQMKLRPAFPVDLLVRTPEKIKERIAMGDTFMQDILTQGRVLYEAADR
jgi:predicted nucleotidyltransferase